MYRGDAGSGFADGEAFEGQHVFYNLDRSLADVIDSAGVVNVGLVIGAGLSLAVYIALSISNAHSSVYNHAVSARQCLSRLCAYFVPCLLALNPTPPSAPAPLGSLHSSLQHSTFIFILSPFHLPTFYQLPLHN